MEFSRDAPQRHERQVRAVGKTARSHLAERTVVSTLVSTSAVDFPDFVDGAWATLIANSVGAIAGWKRRLATIVTYTEQK